MPSFAPEEEDSGPPSSINVARALASLRADELRRVEEIVAQDEEERAKAAAPAPAPPPPSPPAVPTLVLGKTIALSDLAEKMGLSSRDLPATLVARGFYALTAKTVLPRETARVIAEMYGWRVEAGPPELDEPSPVKSGVRSRIATKPKARAKSKAATKAKTTKAKTKAKTTKAKAPKTTKPVKRRLAR